LGIRSPPSAADVSMFANSPRYIGRPPPTPVGNVHCRLTVFPDCPPGHRRAIIGPKSAEEAKHGRPIHRPFLGGALPEDDRGRHPQLRGQGRVARKLRGAENAPQPTPRRRHSNRRRSSRPTDPTGLAFARAAHRRSHGQPARAGLCHRSRRRADLPGLPPRPGRRRFADRSGRFITVARSARQDAHLRPSGPTPVPSYASVQSYKPGDQVPLVLDGASVGTVSVAELLP
jgi:hypothetical protein